MYTYEDIVRALKNIGLEKNDTLLVHSSMKAIGMVDGGADTVIKALMKCTEDGMLILPAHTWATMTQEHNIYDSQREPSCVGILSNIFMRMPGVIRTLHPTHSLAVWCKDINRAKEFAQGEENMTTPCARQGCYGKLYDLKAKIMLLGCGLNKNTYFHGVEEWYGICERLTDYTLPLKIVMPDKTLKDCNMKKHFKPNGISVSEYYVKMEKPLLDNKIMRQGKVGDAKVMLIKAKEAADLFTNYLKINRDEFTDFDAID